MTSSFNLHIDDGNQREIRLRWNNKYTIDSFLVMAVDSEKCCLSIKLIDFLSSQRPVFSIHEDVQVYVLHVYGLKTSRTETGRYQRALYHAKIRIKADKSDIKLSLDMKRYTECDSPIQRDHKGTMPLDVKKKPPSFYTLEADTLYQNIIKYIIFISYDDHLFICCKEGTSLSLSVPMTLPPATWITCQTFCQDMNCVLHSNPVRCETFLTVVENRKLYDLAIKFKKPRGMKKIKYFYRNKNQIYFDEVMNEMEGIVTPMLKNNGGEQGSVINGNFHGIFFSTYLDTRTKKPWRYSYFGPIRFNVQAEHIFTTDCNLYFADFYCHYWKHHVVAILTPSSSYLNTFCGKYLQKLDIYDNPFIKLQKSGATGAWDVMANMDIIVEVYYTETVNITSVLKKKLGYMETVKTIGRGYVLPQGVPKNPSCSKCNL